MSWVITGGAGFIGSCLISKLNQEGLSDIIIVDNIGKSSKWRNIVNKEFRSYYQKNEFLHSINSISRIDGIVHLGACSSTAEDNFDYLYANNYIYSIELGKFCLSRRIPFIYASSAAVYGSGSNGFSDSVDSISLVPLNRYGYSKLLTDRWILKKRNEFFQYVGLRFFNVYGPNEYHKGIMASMVYQGYHQICNTGTIHLYKSLNPLYEDGSQSRDFIFVADICEIIWYFINHPEKSGVFNIGSGESHTFNDLASFLFSALGKAPKIEYINMPSKYIYSYQEHTKADIAKLRESGYTKNMMPFQVGIQKYVKSFLALNEKIL